MKFNLYEFALMEGFIKLGRCYGVKLWQLPIEYDRSTGVTYITGTPADPEARAGFNEMLKALGHTGKEPAFPQEEGQEMLDALDEAIRNAPRKWVR